MPASGLDWAVGPLPAPLALSVSLTPNCPLSALNLTFLTLTERVLVIKFCSQLPGPTDTVMASAFANGRALGCKLARTRAHRKPGKGRVPLTGSGVGTRGCSLCPLAVGRMPIPAPQVTDESWPQSSGGRCQSDLIARWGPAGADSGIFHVLLRTFLFMFLAGFVNYESRRLQRVCYYDHNSFKGRKMKAERKSASPQS